MSDPNASQRIADLELEIARLQQSSTGARAQVHELQAELKKLQGEEGVNLSWQRVQMARHPKRPHSLDYIERLVPDFTEIHGDRAFGEDAAIICGFGTIAGSQAMIIGQEKGRDTKQKLHRNFGMPKPEGYRKALRAMQMAEKFRRPVITFLDTPGAYPGIDAEERGQAQAIALNLREMARLETPIIVVVIGEGGSGGALALGIGNRVLMLENAVYSVISPESCAAIIYRDAAKGNIAAAALRITAGDLERLQLIDGIIPEPPGGAHEDYDRAADLLRQALAGALRELAPLSAEVLVKQRYDRFRNIGNFFEESAG
ncbi:MAG TPA: acetyl-CoA carboxylase carboxyltransferase subunit alpha [Bryobacteraceae bacterium]|nr:acetyl-CoA carboxylase carboxyl transferase subunit alpha [Bryobacterales bacterium]HRJ20086.1 acetyl-CoA carboxylase carboxyltransferase subunit alpha [Bryobacteraceae bacterium]